MKRIYALLAFLTLVSQFGFGQETVGQEGKKHQQFYVSLGPGTAFTTSKLVVSSGYHRNLFITATYPSNKIFRAGFSISEFADDQPETRAFLQDYPGGGIAHHSVVSPYFALGKRRLLNKYVQLQALAGLSFNWHHGAENIYRYIVNNGPVNNGSTNTFEAIGFTMTNRFVPGLVLQAEVMALPLPFAGLTFGGYYNFIPKISHAGLNLSLNLGRIRLRS